MARQPTKVFAVFAVWLLGAAGAFACNPVEGETVTLTKGTVGAIQPSADFDTGEAIWLINVSWGNSSNGCLINDILVKSEPKTCKIDSRFEVTGTLQIAADYDGDTYTIVAPELVCQ